LKENVKREIVQSREKEAKEAKEAEEAKEEAKEEEGEEEEEEEEEEEDGQMKGGGRGESDWSYCLSGMVARGSADRGDIARREEGDRWGMADVRG